MRAGARLAATAGDASSSPASGREHAPTPFQLADFVGRRRQRRSAFSPATSCQSHAAGYFRGIIAELRAVGAKTSSKSKPMTVSPRSDAAAKVDIAKTMERARASWRAGDPDGAENGVPTGAGGMARPSGRVLSHGANGPSLRQSRFGARPLAPGLPSATRAGSFFQRLRRNVPAGWAFGRRRAGGATRGGACPELRCGVEQSRHHPAGDAEARRKPALPREGSGARAQQCRDAQQSRQHLEAAWPSSGSGSALDRSSQAQARLR